MATLRKAKLIHKVTCNHSGGIIDPDDCIVNFINKRNEEKVFVGTNDEGLRNTLRNLGTVPIFFFNRQVLIMDTPSDAFKQKMDLKELLKLEPTKQEQKFIKSNRDIIDRIKEEEKEEERKKNIAKNKEIYCMGIKTKLAKGANPLSMPKKQIKPKVDRQKQDYFLRKEFPGEIKKKRRLRKGKRSRELSLKKKEEKKIEEKED